MNRILLVTALTLSLFACGGGDDGKEPTNPGGQSGNHMTAKIDGVAWTGSAEVHAGTSGARMANMNIIGTDLSPLVSVILNLSFVEGPGVYPLGVNPLTNAGGTGSVVRATDHWLTPLSAMAGSVTITTRTSTRIAGTFAFTADRTPGTGAPVVVTDGEFDVTKAAGLPPLPTGTGSEVSAEMDGTSWSGATVSVEQNGERFGGSNTTYAMSVGFHDAPIQGHTYAIGPTASMSASRTDNNDSWLSASQDSVGYVIVSKVTAERLEGTFAGHLAPAGTASSPLVVTNGSFSVHIP